MTAPEGVPEDPVIVAFLAAAPLVPVSSRGSSSGRHPRRQGDAADAISCLAEGCDGPLARGCAYYVQSHGDHHYDPADGERYAGFREDAGRCTGAAVAAVVLVTWTTDGDHDG